MSGASTGIPDCDRLPRRASSSASLVLYCRVPTLPTLTCQHITRRVLACNCLYLPAVTPHNQTPDVPPNAVGVLLRFTACVCACVCSALQLWGCLTLFMTANLLKVLFAKMLCESTAGG